MSPNRGRYTPYGEQKMQLHAAKYKRDWPYEDTKLAHFNLNQCDLILVDRGASPTRED